jgi:hypothetical protein
MLVVRRALLIIFLVCAPAALLWAFGIGTDILLDRMNGTLDPSVRKMLTVFEALIFYGIAALEVRDRWTPRSI